MTGSANSSSHSGFGNIIYLLLILTISCQDTTVLYYQREGRTLRLLESEFKQQHTILNHGFAARDSKSIVKVNVTDTIQISKDAILFKYNYVGVLPNGEELPLNAPHEGVFGYIGNRLPDFVLPDLDGQLIHLSEFYGKPLVLNFWFRACTPCKKEMPRLNQIKERYEEQVTFVAICLDDIDELKGFFKYHDFDYEHLINGGEIANQLGIMVYPKNIVINREGEVSQILDALLETMDEDENVFPGKERN
ncbi:MAG: TlpA family protein disulfide reductase [Saprospiraceae bacterium]|nr:TlpA family protein disulfide reductase [Saprospiraceae bacterium]